MIAKDNRPVAFFSRKSSNMQQKYSITRIELLAIVGLQRNAVGSIYQGLH
jgi:hypothetical protein